MIYVWFFSVLVFSAYGIEIRMAEETLFNNNNDDGNMLFNGEYNVIRQLITKEMTVFDVGANSGEW